MSAFVLETPRRKRQREFRDALESKKRELGREFTPDEYLAFKTQQREREQAEKAERPQSTQFTRSARPTQAQSEQMQRVQSVREPATQPKAEPKEKLSGRERRRKYIWTNVRTTKADGIEHVSFKQAEKVENPNPFSLRSTLNMFELHGAFHPDWETVEAITDSQLAHEPLRNFSVAVFKMSRPRGIDYGLVEYQPA